MDQLGELARWQTQLAEVADVYVSNPDPPAAAARVRALSGIRVPILRDPHYELAKRFGLAGRDRPMGGLVGYVIIDGEGIIRVQKVDIDFGDHAQEMLRIARGLRAGSSRAAETSPRAGSR